MTAGLVVPTVKPDADNVAKIVLDALNGSAFCDDAQVVHLQVLKRYAEEPGVKVRITVYEEFLKNCVVTVKG
jgi:Holliday junction resolvase RusA-like endonuclease